jgi:hypothetical protein
MIQRCLSKQLCLFLIVSFAILSCGKKATYITSTPSLPSTSLTSPDNPEKTYATEENIQQPEIGPDIGYSKDAIENGINMDNFNEVLLMGRGQWTTEFRYSHIDFKRDNTYLLLTAPEGDWFGEGVYRVEENDVIVEYPLKGYISEGLIANTMEWLFEGKNLTVLTYDKSYRDFDVLTCLWHGEKKLRNWAIGSPLGEEYELDGFQVVKYYHVENEVLILENLKMRKLPEITADTVTLGRWVEILYGNPSSYVGRSFRSDVAYADTVASFDAKTVKKDTIDGITAPWYRIWIVLNDFESASVWVFGGYLRELSPSERENKDYYYDYYKKYFQRLLDNGIIEPIIYE